MLLDVSPHATKLAFASPRQVATTILTSRCTIGITLQRRGSGGLVGPMVSRRYRVRRTPIIQRAIIRSTPTCRCTCVSRLSTTTWAFGKQAARLLVGRGVHDSTVSTFHEWRRSMEVWRRRRMTPSQLAIAGLLTALSFCRGAAAGEPPKPGGGSEVVGLWESEARNTIRSVLWLSPAGEALWASVTADDGTYEVRGQKLVLRVPLGGEIRELPLELGELTSSTWKREVSGWAEVRKRVGSSGEVSVHGLWTYMHRLGRMAFER